MESVWSALELSWTALGGLLAPCSTPKDPEHSPGDGDLTPSGLWGGGARRGAPGLLDRDPIAPRPRWTEDPIAPGLLERGKDYASQPDAPGKQGPADLGGFRLFSNCV